MVEVLKEFTEKFSESFKKKSFLKLILSKPIHKSEPLQRVNIKVVELKNVLQLQFTYRFKTNDQTKNYDINEAINEVTSLISNQFKIATIFNKEETIILTQSKKGKYVLRQTKGSEIKPLTHSHDKTKKKLTIADDQYLHALGISDINGAIIPKMADKYRQINKYLEIIETQVSQVQLPSKVNIVDMGSGKGYLTFALYDYLKNKKQLDVNVVGIELRMELVDLCNKIALECGFEQLRFVCERIENYKTDKIDILIALHACDTATDDAIMKGIESEAALIICAPCCHKQLRQQTKGLEQDNPMMKYGIFKERQFEMVTDTIRALLLEKQQYSSSLFEFISNEHTRKNVMLVGTKTEKKKNIDEIDQKLNELKSSFNINTHYLETLLNKEGLG